MVLRDGQSNPKTICRYRSRFRIFPEASKQRLFNIYIGPSQPCQAGFQPPRFICQAAVNEIRPMSLMTFLRDIVENFLQIDPIFCDYIIHNIYSGWASGREAISSLSATSGSIIQARSVGLQASMVYFTEGRWAEVSALAWVIFGCGGLGSMAALSNRVSEWFPDYVKSSEAGSREAAWADDGGRC